MSDPKGGRNQTFRNEEVRRLAWIFGIGILAITSMVPILGKNASWIEPIPFVAPFIFVAWRMGRVRVVTSETGVEVVNPVKTHHVPWDQVIRFKMGEGEFMRRQEQPYLETPDKTISLVAVGSMNSFSRASNDKAKATIDNLNELLQFHTHGRPALEKSPVGQRAEQLRRLGGVVIPLVGAALYLFSAEEGEGMTLVKVSLLVVCVLISVSSLVTYLKARRDSK